MKEKHIKTKAASKPRKPSPDFPLTPHPSGLWCKKINKKLYYFGKWSDPQAALEKYTEEKDDLFAGRKPRAKAAEGELTIRELANLFLTAKLDKVDSGEITARTFSEYHAICELIIKVFGKGRAVSDLMPADFADLRKGMAKRLGLVALGNQVQRVRTVFRWGEQSLHITQPTRFGPDFVKPSKKALRAARNERPARMFSAEEIRKLIETATQPLKAMILLGINAGFGNHDCGSLPVKAVDLKAGWVNFPRPKTGITRRCPLWPETIAALQEALELRPTAKETQHAELVFVTKYGAPWGKETRDNPIQKEMTKLLKTLKMHQPGRGFYSLRHAFETAGGGSRDQVAVDAIMGHAREDMATIYREGVTDDRLQAVVDFVHDWLFAKPESKPGHPTKTKKVAAKRSPKKSGR